MNDTKKIYTGFVIFLILVISPFIFRVFGSPGSRPQVELPTDQQKCVESKEFMAGSHMQLLDEWRDAAVRENTRVYVASDDTRHTMSLTNTCLGCHTSRQNFCDKCHDYVGVDPYCWDCHMDPVEDE